MAKRMVVTVAEDFEDQGVQFQEGTDYVATIDADGNVVFPEGQISIKAHVIARDKFIETAEQDAIAAQIIELKQKLNSSK